MSRGCVEIQIIAADPEGFCTAAAQAGIALHRVKHPEELTLLCSGREGDLPALIMLANARGAELRVLRRRGASVWIAGLIKRPVLVLGLLGLLLLSVLLPRRVLFIQVDGNNQVGTGTILEAAEDAGLVFGASRRELRNQQIKNSLLASLPELRWVGVNTRGCTAQITVREGTSMEGPGGSWEFLTASHSGIVEHITVSRGTALCQAGQAVERGQVLISGYADCGGVALQTGAQGRIQALTQRKIAVEASSAALQREENPRKRLQVSLILGKKRINFGKDSRICPATCGRMYTEYWLKLPGGFVLPVCLAVEQVYWFDTQGTQAPEGENFLKEFARLYLLGQMDSGRILREDWLLLPGDPARLEGELTCQEEIGMPQREMIGEYNGKDD